MVQAGTQGIYAEVAERDSGNGRGWPMGGCLCDMPPLDTRAHTYVRNTRRHTRAARQTSNKSFNKFCGSDGGGDGGGGGGGGKL